MSSSFAITLFQPRIKFFIKIKTYNHISLVRYEKSFREYLGEAFSGKDKRRYYATSFLDLEFDCDPFFFLHILGEIEPTQFTTLYTDLQSRITSIYLVFTLKDVEQIGWIYSRFIGLKENYPNLERLAGDRILLDKSARIKFSPVNHLAFFASFCYYLRHCQ